MRHQAALFERLEPRQMMSGSTIPKTTTPATGLAAVYYANDDFTGASTTRTDSTVNFSWNGAAPATGIGGKNFSARWTGNVIAVKAGTYTFSATFTDGARLWVNNHLLINDWTTNAAPVSKSGTISLGAGAQASIRLEYFDVTDPASVHLYWSGPSLSKAVIPSKQLRPTTDPLLGEIDQAMGFARQQLNQTLADLNGKTTAFPTVTNSNGTWQTSNKDYWTSGFFAAELWQMYQRTNNSYWKQEATTWTLPLQSEDTQPDDTVFRIFNEYYPLYEATGNKAYAQVIFNAATARVATYNSAVGAFHSVEIPSHSGNPAANFGVLTDQTMDLSMVFWAAKQTGNTSWATKALQTEKTLMNNMMRPDGSVYQWGYFNSTTGKVVSLENNQGYSDASTWSRGQAWAINSFGTAYLDTGDSTMLTAAEKVANYFIGHLPADHIPYWDFDAPGIPNTYRDTSAASIAASGLLQLASLEKNSANATKYRSAAVAILNSLLSSSYLAKGSTSHGILLHGAWFVPSPINNGDASTIWGDYYLLQAMNEYLAMPHSLPGT
ncbi:MAG TPA: PA14 domain-containing protein [Tepidisphaeraceae bacterium]|nr:PA14 domain-containing protein [Tepidisphaeraceae bacterium]